MDLETKMELLKLTDSYWTLLPAEIKEIILKYKESQELIDRRESASNHALCKQIRLYIHTYFILFGVLYMVHQHCSK